MGREGEQDEAKVKKKKDTLAHKSVLGQEGDPREVMSRETRVL